MFWNLHGHDAFSYLHTGIAGNEWLFACPQNLRTLGHELGLDDPEHSSEDIQPVNELYRTDA